MAKYRRKQLKTQIVDALNGWRWGRSHRPGRTTHEKHFWTIFTGEDGLLVEWHSDDFDREYERVEESSVLCVACGTRLSLDRLAFLREFGEAPVFQCRACWEKCEASKKPTPLTLADLSPGDVFTFKEWCYSCAPGRGASGQRQILNNNHYFNPEMKSGLDSTLLDSTWRARQVVLLAHHDLTPKQLLWIDASDEERKALDDSIREKWLPRTRGEAKSRGECALCERHTRPHDALDCENCIVGEAGESCSTRDAPWGRWFRGTDGWGKLAPNWTPGDSQAYVLTRRVALSLAEFLPDIDPTRIEVEATPVEWPGASK